MLIGLTDKQEDDLLTHMELEELIESLPPKRRVVIAMRVAGFEQRTIAALIGGTQVAVSYIERTAHKYLLERLTDD